MKQSSKSVQYVLIGLVAIIWGAIIYQVLQYTGDDGDEGIYSQMSYQPPAAAPAQDSFKLNLNYPDPFTGRQNTRSVSTTNTNSSTRRRPRTNKQPTAAPTTTESITPPNINYIGYSLNDETITHARLRVDGKSSTFQLNETKAGIKITSIDKGSVTISYKGKEFVFLRE